MAALLALISTKDYVYAAVIAALLAGAGWYTIHERHEGAVKIEAADKRTALVAVAKDAAIIAAAQTTSNSIGTVYEKAVAIPAVADVGLVCQSPRSRPVSSGPDYRPEAPDSTDVVAQRLFDPSGGILTLLRDDDAQINGLIDQVDLLTTTMDKLHEATK